MLWFWACHRSIGTVKGPFYCSWRKQDNIYLVNFGILPRSITLATSIKWAPSSEFVSSSIPSWQTLTAHAQPFRGARDLAFCLKVPLDSLLVWASSEGSGETARMRRLAWTFAARIGDKYPIRLTRSKLRSCLIKRCFTSIRSIGSDHYDLSSSQMSLQT